MIKNKNKKSGWNKWRRKYRFVVLNSETFEERFSISSSKFGFFTFFFGCAVFIITLTSLIISYSPVRELIPGYTSTNIRRQMVALNLLSDSLKNELNYRQQYVENIKNIINGGAIDTIGSTVKRTIALPKTITANKISEDSLLRKNIEQEERFNFFGSTIQKNESINSLLFFVPVNGIITESFTPNSGHYGVDIVSKENAHIKSTLSGIVVLSSWTSGSGHVIAVQHKNGLLSIYKHNSVLLKSQGDLVQAGETIAIIGNSGKWSSGPHLHFELWLENNPLDPEHFVKF